MIRSYVGCCWIVRTCLWLPLPSWVVGGDILSAASGFENQEYAGADGENSASWGPAALAMQGWLPISVPWPVVVRWYGIFFVKLAMFRLGAARAIMSLIDVEDSVGGASVEHDLE